MCVGVYLLVADNLKNGRQNKSFSFEETALNNKHPERVFFFVLLAGMIICGVI